VNALLANGFFGAISTHNANISGKFVWWHVVLMNEETAIITSGHG
jgi:hypothetical protein